MKLYINELAPWERKKEYYNNIQLGRDLNSQTEAIITPAIEYVNFKRHNQLSGA